MKMIGHPAAGAAASATERMRRLAGALLAVGAVSLAGAGPANAFQFADMLRNAAQAAAAARPTPSPSSPQSNNGQAPAGPMGLQEKTPIQVHKLGTDAVAVVDSATGTTAVRQMDYVFAKQSINLGPKGVVTLSYLSGCRTEVITGGVVTVEPTGSSVARGKLTERTTPGCKSAKPIILASASEAGATVNRITPFSGANWEERAIKSDKAVFKWDKALGPVTIRVKDMDKDGDPVLWQATPAVDWAAYPATSPKLVAGAPYKVEAVSGDKVVASALFSIDAQLDVADNTANRVVPLSTP
jgi:hypothetical protein